MEMRTGHSAGRADRSDDLPNFNLIAFLNRERGQVREQREDSETVVDHDRVPGEVELVRQHDATGIGRVDRRAGRTGKIRAAVRRACLAIEDTARAEAACRLLWHPRDK